MAKKKKRTLAQVIAQDNFTVTSSAGAAPMIGSNLLSILNGQGVGNPLLQGFTNPLAPPGGTVTPLLHNNPDPDGTYYLPLNQQNAASSGGINWEGVGGGLCGLIPNAALRAACMGVATVLPDGKDPGRGADSSNPRNTNQYFSPGATNCPAGYVADGKGGCKQAGVAGAIAGVLPGDIGMPDTGWTPMAGRYGVGVSPLPVQRVMRACPPGFVLGKDGVCYEHLARTNRAHNPGRKPLLTGGDLTALARARQLQKTIGKINTRFGPKKRATGHTHADHHPRKK